MVKECRVLFTNKAVTVVKYGNDEIQFPSVAENLKSVFVKLENGKYFIVDKPEPEEAPEKNIRKAIRKKTTSKESEEDECVVE